MTALAVARPGARLGAGADLLRCARPGCGGALGAASRGLVCGACRARFPVLGGRAPVLLAEPQRFLAQELWRLQAGIRRLRGIAAQFGRAAQQQPARAAIHLAARQGSLRNVAFLEDVRALLLPHVGGEELLEAGDEAAAGGQSIYGAQHPIYELLRRDWGGAPEAEAEMEELVALACARLGDTAGGPGLLIGAGMGRLPHELRRVFAPLVAVDLSSLMIASYCLIEAGTVRVSDVNTRNTRTPADQTVDLELVLREREPAPPPMTLLLGDATALPLPDAAVGAVVSVYTTDAIPLSALLPELARVLRPGGRFVHVGPLGYHFGDVTNHLAASEWPAAFAAAGFVVRELGYQRTTHCAHTRGLYRATFDNLCVTAERVGAARDVG